MCNKVGPRAGVFGAVPPLHELRALPLRGRGETNNRARFNQVEPPFIENLASAPHRIIMKFDQKPKGYMMLITGENEYFMSMHNTDINDASLNHEYFCLENEAVVYKTVIQPEKK